jgi:tetratricopeptide (TPR) repeat protein
VHRKSILRKVTSDPKKLPIGALEAFVLSQVGRQAIAEDVAEATGLELSELFRVARHLVDLGALSVDGEKQKTKRPTMAPHRAAGTHNTAAPQRRRATTVPPRKSRESLVPPTLVPARRKPAEVRSLGIGPIEGFVLSQIDGVTSVADLGEITGLAAPELAVALRALEAAGAVNLGPIKRRPSTSGLRSTVQKAAPAAAAFVAVDAPVTAQPSRDVEACDLSDADRASITETAAQIETHDLYRVLGIERDADAKAIRRAYHALAGQFHPDRHFGRKLGPLRRPLERIFMRLTLAYDTLSRRDKRAEYDATLSPRPAPRALSQKPPPSTKRAPTQKPSPAPPPSRKSLRADAPAISSVQSRPVVPPAPRPPAPLVPPAAASAPHPAMPPPTVANPPSPASSPSPGRQPEAPRRVDAPRDRRPPQERALVFVRAAEDALDRHDFVAAAHHYRLAVQCSDDPTLRVALAETEVKARRRVRETSLAAASAAEQAGRWGDAGEKYSKAHALQPEPRVAERAANAIRMAGGDLRAAARLAEQAVLAEPGNASYRVTLGEIYFDAGLFARAAGESARAVALAPSDPRASALAKMVAKGKRA